MSTLQTAEPLAELRTETSGRALMWFERLADGGETELDIDQPYQRGDVWGVERRRLLIRSLMLGVPTGAITVNDRFAAGFQESAYGSDRRTPSRNWATAIIDGKQRFTTLVMWMRSGLAVPASWFPDSEILSTEDTEDGPYVRLSGLAPRQRRFFSNKPVPVVSAKVRTLAAEREIFDLINFGGGRAGREGLTNSRFDGIKRHGVIMDDSELHDLLGDLNEMTTEYGTDKSVMLEHRIALLQARSIAVLAEQVHQTGQQIERAVDLFEEFTPAPSRWQWMRRWLP